MRVVVVVAIACLSAVGLCAGQDVEASIKKFTNIPAQELVPALKTLAYERGFQLVFLSNVVGAKHTQGAVGDLTTTEALTKLLEGTNLVYSYLDNKTVTILTVNSNNKLDEQGHSAGKSGRCSGLFSNRLDYATSLNQTAPGSTAINWTSSKEPSYCLERYSHQNLELASTIAGAEAAPVQNNSDGQSNLSNDSAPSPFAIEEVVVSSKRYGATTNSSGRLATPYIDTPQATSIVTADLLKDANLFDSSAALKFVPNVQQWSSQGSNVYIRGLSTGALYIDGFAYGSGITIDTGFADRIEVVKGPSSAAFGRGDPAGFINYVLKGPRFVRSTEASAMVGSGGPRNNMRFLLDNDGFVTDDEQTAYRAVAMYSNGSATRDHSEFERSGVLLSVDHRLGNRGDLKVNANLVRNHNPGNTALTSWSDPTVRSVLMRNTGNTTLGIPFLDSDFVFAVDGSDTVLNGFGSTAVLEYKLGDHWNTRQAVNFNDTDNSGIATGANPSVVQRNASGVLTLANPIFDSSSESRSWSYQADFLWKRESRFLDSKYSLLFGGDFSDQWGYTASQVTLYPRQPLLTWNPHLPYSFAADINKIGVQTTGSQWSPYGQLSASFLDGKIQPTFAARRLYFDLKSTNRANGQITLNNRSTPVFGTLSIMFKPLKWLSIYGVKTRYQEPPAVVSEYGGVPISDPRFALTIATQPKTDLKEVGIKGNLLDEQVTFSVCAFRLRSIGTGRFYSFFESGNPAPLSRVFLSDDSVTGWEFEVFGRPTRQLTLMFGGGFLDSDANFPAADAIYRIPYAGLPNTVYGNLSYSFGPSADSGLSARVGAKAYLAGWNVNGALTGGPTAVLPNEVRYPHTNTVIDLGVAYGFDGGRYTLSLDVNNAFHERATFNGNVQYMETGRLVFLRLDMKL